MTTLSERILRVVTSTWPQDRIPAAVLAEIQTDCVIINRARWERVLACVSPMPAWVKAPADSLEWCNADDAVVAAVMNLQPGDLDAEDGA